MDEIDDFEGTLYESPCPVYTTTLKKFRSVDIISSLPTLDNLKSLKIFDLRFYLFNKNNLSRYQLNTSFKMDPLLKSFRLETITYTNLELKFVIHDSFN